MSQSTSAKERLQRRLSPEQFAALSARADFTYVLGMSDFIVNTLYAYPEQCLELIGSGALEQGRVEREKLTKKIESYLAEGLPDEELKHRLRVLRRTEYLVIAWRDLTGRAGLDEVLERLTETAELIVLRTLKLVRQSFLRKYGDALCEQGEQLPLLCYGMGKLGGGELNFSSDLDLIFAYPYEGQTQGGIQQVSFKEFFTRIVQRFANLMQDLTVDGFCYRIDLRLRPFGDAGALVSSFDALSRYYETQGRTWERYALVKARLLGSHEAYGDYGDYGAELVEMLRPFVFRRYLDYGAIMSLRKLKHMIEAEVRRRKLTNNFKLGKGGIREIEFVAQVFQLMRGGRIPELQERSLRKTLAHLSSLELLPYEVCRLLDTCYQYLRRLENCLQEFADQQTQDLPDQPLGQVRLALSMNYPSFSELCLDLEKIMTAVHDEFDKVVSSDEKEGSDNLEGLELWESPLSEEELGELLCRYQMDTSFIAPYARAIQTSRAALAAMPVGPVGRETLLHLMPKVILKVSRYQEPHVLFNKVSSLIAKVALRTTYLQLLDQHDHALDRLITLVDKNAFALELISAHPILLDELIVPQYLDAPPSTSEFLQLLQERLVRIPSDDLEEQMEELRLFKKMMVLRIAMSDQSEHLPLMKISDSLTFLAEAMLQELMVLAWEQMTVKFGIPPHCSSTDPGLALIAYGKLGGIELGYKSDLDMVFIRAVDDGYTEGEHSTPCGMFYQRLVQRLVHLSTTRTMGGVLYDLDMRLRPDGDSGLLITDISGYESYQRQRAWTWEHQALVRARPVAGSPALIAEFKRIREAVLRTPRDQHKLREDVLNMREKMRRHLDKSSAEWFDLKEGAGGIVDIEFIAQYLTLREAPVHQDMVLWSDNVRIFEECARLGVITGEVADTLKEAYLQLRGIYHRLSLAEQAARIPREEVPASLAQVSAIWQEIFGA